MFGRITVAALGAAASLSLVAHPEPAHAQNYVERSATCVATMQRLNPGTHIRAGLTENKCSLSTPSTAYRGTPRQTWLASGAACDTDLGELPPCGIETNLHETLPGAVRRIELGGGKCLHVIPVMLTDKTDGFKCNAVKARTACVADVRQDGGKTIVTLAGGRERGALKAEIVIPANPEHHVPLIAKSKSGPLMALIPTDVTIGAETHDSQGFLQHYAKQAYATCAESLSACREQANYQVDRAVGELMRRVWNPRVLVSRDERKADFESFVDAVMSSDLGRNSREKKLYAKLIIENEVSGASPYQVLDAVIRNSSMSWGAHQIDIGANEQSEVTLFWDTLRNWRRAPGTGNYPKLREADTMRSCLSQPIRNFFVDHLALYYAAMPDMNKGFRSPLGRASYDARFKAYLDEEVSRGLALKGLFKKSPFAWMYFVDQRNQRGPSAADGIRKIGVAMEPGDLSSCEDVAGGEQRLVDYIKSLTAEGEWYDIDRRVGNLRKLLTKEYDANLGRTCGG